MHGDGTKPAITKVDVSTARLLDLTRSLRRAGRMPTGVDRVERAYLRHLLTEDVPLFGLIRTAFGYVLLDRRGAQAFLDRLEGRKGWPAPDMMSRLPRGRDRGVSSAETSVRRDARARCLPMGLRRMLARHVPKGFAYFNTGHSNLTDRVLGAVKSADGGINALIHDVIPLERPEFQRTDIVMPFQDKMQRISRLADRVIYNSKDTQARAEAKMQAWGRVPPSCVAHLGIDVSPPDAAQLPQGLMPKRPYFVTVGTIEPRKNHAFLLNLWEEMGPDAPPLLICGSRGWNNDDVFHRLDNLPAGGAVREVSGLTDPALSALIKGSAGLLFPSHAEGFGLPAVEALTLGARVLCNDLPVFREILGNCADFVPVSDAQSWLEILEDWEIKPSEARKATGFVAPDWGDHFNTVLGLR